MGHNCGRHSPSGKGKKGVMATQQPITFTVIGGFLGAGKTSFVNRLLANGGAGRFAAVEMVNDFGALNIDESLITETDGQVMQLANGCICCSLAGGLVEAMINLMQYRDQFDHILIEASGVSNPSRIMDFARIDHELRCGSIIVLADAARLTDQLADPRLHETLQDQLASADIFLLTKTDLATKAQIAEARTTLAHHQPHVPIITLLSDDADLAQLLVPDDDTDSQSHHVPWTTIRMTICRILTALRWCRKGRSTGWHFRVSANNLATLFYAARALSNLSRAP